MGKAFFFLKRIILKILAYLNTIANNSQVTNLGETTFGHKARVFNIQDNIKKIIISGKSFINGELLIYKHGGEILIGEHCFIGENTKIWSAKRIIIGNRVLIAHNVNIHDSNDHPVDANLRHQHFKDILFKGHVNAIDLDEKEINIEDDVWIGFNATILKGLNIGRGAIVGACSVVTKDVPPYSIVVGNPAKVVKYLKNTE
jgi:acetyltransferase-like isoleucine patch superfamily enzyme